MKDGNYFYDVNPCLSFPKLFESHLSFKSVTLLVSNKFIYIFLNYTFNSKSMNTLTGIEAERVNQILKYAIDRLVVLSYVPLMWSDDIVVDITCQPVLNSV